MGEKLVVRLAKEQDFQDVLEASEGVYDGSDYLPFVFHQWLKTPDKYTFVGELHGRIVAFQAATVLDGGQTIYSHSLRIHQEYRGMGCGYQMMTEVVNQVRRVTSGSSKVRLTIDRNNKAMEALYKKLAYKVVLERRQFSFHANKSICNAFLKNNLNESKQLHDLGVKEAVQLVLNEKNFNLAIPSGILAFTSAPACELMPANAELIFKEGDKIFTDATAEQIAEKNFIPKSFSLGRKVEYVKMQTWICNIYASERDVFKAHLIRHIMAAIGQMDADGMMFEVFYDNKADFHGQEVLEEIFSGIRQRISIVTGSYKDNLVAYESSFVKQTVPSC